MKILKVVSHHIYNFRAASLLVATLFVGVAALGADAPRGFEGESTKESTSKSVLSEGEYFQETPFGLARRGPVRPVDKLAGTRNVEVEESGDLITFRRTTPFGKQVWRRKYPKLSAFEMRLLKVHHRASLPGKAPKVSSDTEKATR
jgi:hypothetical protein